MTDLLHAPKIAVRGMHVLMGASTRAMPVLLQFAAKSFNFTSATGSLRTPQPLAQFPQQNCAYLALASTCPTHMTKAALTIWPSEGGRMQSAFCSLFSCPKCVFIAFLQRGRLLKDSNWIGQLDLRVDRQWRQIPTLGALYPWPSSGKVRSRPRHVWPQTMLKDLKFK